MSVCSSCGVEIPVGQEVTLRGKDKNALPMTICQNCANAVESTLQAETENPNWLGALLLGLGAAVVSTLVWYGIVAITQYQLGVIAVGVGWLVGMGVRYGSGQKRGVPLQIISIVITLIAMIAGEYLVIRHFAVQALAEEGYTDIPLLLPAGTMLTLIAESVKEDPLTLLFWGIAAWEAFSIPARRRLRQA